MKFLLSIAILFSIQSFGEENLCEKAFDNEVSAVMRYMGERKNSRRWHRFAGFVSRFDHCMDGYYAQTAQSIAERGLAEDWAGFIDYSNRYKLKEVPMKHFRGGYNPEMGTPEMLSQIRANAKNNCSPKLKEFCANILKN